MAPRRKTRQEAKIINRQLQALDLRKRGLSYRAIGQRLDCSHEIARQDVETELARLAVERADRTEELRQLELERLDAMLEALDPMVSVGNPASVSTALRVMERRAKLLGLDAPTKQDITSGGEKLTGLIINLDDHDAPGN